MSYILDALNKAERDRQVSRVPGLATSTRRRRLGAPVSVAVGRGRCPGRERGSRLRPLGTWPSGAGPGERAAGRRASVDLEHRTRASTLAGGSRVGGSGGGGRRRLGPGRRACRPPASRLRGRASHPWRRPRGPRRLRARRCPPPCAGGGIAGGCPRDPACGRVQRSAPPAAAGTRPGSRRAGRMVTRSPRSRRSPPVRRLPPRLARSRDQLPPSPRAR